MSKKPWVVVFMDMETLDVQIYGYHTEGEAIHMVEELLGDLDLEIEAFEVDGWWQDSPKNSGIRVKWLQVEFPVQ